MSTVAKESGSSPAVEVNGRRYRTGAGPVVVVCVDGSEPAYHERAIEAGLMPFLESVTRRGGASLTADCAMPSFTNPNNLSIATGVPPAVHGICGNFFLDPDTGQEVMMNDPALLRAPTIFAAHAAAGASVAIITAKDKLRRLLGADLDGGICFSAEKADTVTMRQNGIDDVLTMVQMPLPGVYSAELSEVAMAAGVKVLERHRTDLMYISLTDYVQHKHAPGSPQANSFYAMLDGYLAQLDALGATLVVTADHGMNAKSDADGRPNVVYLQDVMDSWFGAGTTRVILPITDPYTAHHGALGSYATIYLSDTDHQPADQQPADHDQADLHRAAVLERLSRLEGVDTVLTAEQACVRFELPRDRIGDLVLLTGKHTAVGTSPGRHDLSGLDQPLRSHGGLTEQQVPFIVNRPVTGIPEGHRLRNFDAYWVATNHARHAVPSQEPLSTSA